jgi:tRNA(Ile)-lysidine synthase
MNNTLWLQFRAYVKDRDLLLPADKIVLALSGGMDSVVLLHLFLLLQKELDFSFVAAHLDHGIRGETSAEDSLFVQQLCDDNKIVCYREYRNIPALAVGHNIEDIARRERYLFLRQLAKECGAGKIATAHHADDQAETVLLHLLRGSGNQGLAAMSPHDQDLIRPLLFAAKSQIEDFCAQNHLSFRQDMTNLDEGYLRNKIRLSLLPHLQKEYNPRIKDSLCSLAEICREENNYMQALTKEQYSIIKESDGGIDKKRLSQMPLALQRRLLRHAYHLASARQLTFSQTEAVLQLAESGSLHLPGIAAYRRQGKIYFGHLPPLKAKDKSIYQICLGDWQPLADGWFYRAHGLSEGENPLLPSDQSSYIILPATNMEKLFFAGRKEGAKFPLPQRKGHKSLKSVYREARIPKEKRDNRPVLYADGQIIWLPFLRKIIKDASSGERIIIYCLQP